VEMSFVLKLPPRMDNNLETAETAHLLGLNGIPVELCLVSQHAHRCIDMARISLADARLQLQVHFCHASGIFLSEYLSINRRLPIHRLVIGLEDRTLTDAIVGRENDEIVRDTVLAPGLGPPG